MALFIRQLVAVMPIGGIKLRPGEDASKLNNRHDNGYRKLKDPAINERHSAKIT